MWLGQSYTANWLELVGQTKRGKEHRAEAVWENILTVSIKYTQVNVTVFIKVERNVINHVVA